MASLSYKIDFQQGVLCDSVAVLENQRPEQEPRHASLTRRQGRRIFGEEFMLRYFRNEASAEGKLFARALLNTNAVVAEESEQKFSLYKNALQEVNGAKERVVDASVSFFTSELTSLSAT